MKFINPLLYREFIQREGELLRAPYSPELEFYHTIKSGDIKKIQTFLKEPFSEKPGLGLLSHNILQNFKYHFTITTALVTRYCIEGGMDFHAAYNLSDYYILTADQCNNIEDISKLHATMCLDYTKRMKQLQKETIYSKHILLCIDYIYENLHTRITVQELANYTKLSSSYLSRLFKQEVGISISEYIQAKKLETAENMLRYSDYSIADISAILAYPSHSYFTDVFRKKNNLTPSQYRNRHYRKLT